MKPQPANTIHATRYCLERFMSEKERDDFDTHGIVPNLSKDPLTIDETELALVRTGTIQTLALLAMDARYVLTLDMKRFKHFDHVTFAWDCARRVGGIEVTLKQDGMVIFTRVGDVKPQPIMKPVKQQNVYRK